MARPIKNKKQDKEILEKKDLISKESSKPKKSIQPKKEIEIKSEIKENKSEENLITPVQQEEIKKSTKKPRRKGWSTCIKCGEQFMTSEMHELSGKKYCDKCYQEEKIDVDYYKKLCSYIYETIYDRDCNMPFITKQIKFLKDSKEQGLENLTNRRILMTLKYAIELEKADISNLDPQWGITNLVDRYFYPAKKFYDLKQKIKEQNKDTKTENNIQVVYIKRSDIIEKQEQYEKEKVLKGAKDLLGEEEMQDIISHLNEFGTKETLGFR